MWGRWGFVRFNIGMEASQSTTLQDDRSILSPMILVLPVRASQCLVQFPVT